MKKIALKVFITGASSGIGEALAKEYASQGALLGLVARRGELLEKLAAEIQTKFAKLDSKVRLYVADVRDEQALQLAVQQFIKEFGSPDIVIASAGVSIGTLTQYAEDIESFKAVMDINVVGVVNTFQPFIAHMIKEHHGQLVGFGSVAGIRGLPGAGAYSASKAAAIAYLESLRVEMQQHGITVTTIAPGYIRTPMTDINPYKMPFLMEVDVAAGKFAKAISAKRRFTVIPWQMGIVARVMRFIPPFLWDSIMRYAPHKPRTMK